MAQVADNGDVSEISRPSYAAAGVSPVRAELVEACRWGMPR